MGLDKKRIKRKRSSGTCGCTLVLFCLLVAPLPVYGQVTLNNFKSITPVDQKMIDEQEIAGAVVMVSHKNKIVHYEAKGLRDVQEKLPMAPDTLFRIYSMTKPITTVAAMMLFEQGRFKLDDAVEK